MGNWGVSHQCAPIVRHPANSGQEQTLKILFYCSLLTMESLRRETLWWLVFDGSKKGTLKAITQLLFFPFHPPNEILSLSRVKLFKVHFKVSSQKCRFPPFSFDGGMSSWKFIIKNRDTTRGSCIKMHFRSELAGHTIKDSGAKRETIAIRTGGWKFKIHYFHAIRGR